ncbi:NUDIX domain-containing protein [Burkholderia gladioli]|uniref:NUDIX domain-containing protein n=1 Tax=Burkholderia gladioli TaxID=28095 RepID=UPI001FC7FC1C|nr:NUDIX domain-containing protein [Burkholderia gladioli]
MKERAPVPCRRGDPILLVARLHARWALPGGRPRRRETLGEAALRELFEETGLVGRPEAYLFRAEGGRKRHHVFLVEVDPLAVARPAREIAPLRLGGPAGAGIDPMQPAHADHRRSRLRANPRAARGGGRHHDVPAGAAGPCGLSRRRPRRLDALSALRTRSACCPPTARPAPWRQCPARSGPATDP